MAKIPIIMQMQASDNGAAALCMMLSAFGRHVSLQEMRSQCITARNGSSPAQVCQAAISYGLEAKTQQVEADDLIPHMPCMITWRNNHYAILTRVKKGIVTIQDPAKGIYDITWDKFITNYSGTLIDLSPGPDFKTGGKQENSFSLFAERLRPYTKQIILLCLFSTASVLISMNAVELRRRMQD
ncbi:MAG: hypothetical protein HUJ75_06515, partial [Parasporobacterium sp.]|nr:hypothetical protein [Parasporobacterium sp.]